jgi:hypothetical protein
MRPQSCHRDHYLRLFNRLFDAHPAHVAMIDLDGTILAVNRAWREFASANGLYGYRFVGVNYLGICQSAAETGDAHAQTALVGLLEVLATGRSKFCVTYPCHAPHERRWFKLWIEPQMPDIPVAIVAHQIVRVEPVGMPPSTVWMQTPT